MSIYSTTKDNIRTLNFTSTDDLVTLEIKTYESNIESLLIEYAYSVDEKIWSDFTNEFDSFLLGAKSIQNNGALFIKIRFTVIMQNSSKILSCFDVEEVLINSFCAKVDYVEMSENSSILTTTKTSNLLNPYRKSKEQDIMVKKISKSISDIFGFDVTYFRTEPLKGNYTFQTYELSDVAEVDTVRIVIKDNYIPDNKTRFSEFDIDFQDEMEMHIVKEVFDDVFKGKIPNANDFLHLPLTNRMYQINTVYDLKEFMNESTFYKLLLVKYEQRADIMKSGDVMDKLDEFVQFDMDFHADDIANDKANAIQPFNDIKHNPTKDHISDESILHEGTEIFKWSYNYKDKLNTDIVLSYDIANVIDNQFSVMTWIKLSDISRWLFNITNTFGQRLLSFNYNQITNNFTASYFVENISDTLTTDPYNTSLSNQWVGIVLNYININNSKMMTISIFDKDLNLIQEVSDSSALQFSTIRTIDFFGGQHYANIRVAKKFIKKSMMKQTLSSMLPKVEDYYVIDNAMPQIKPISNG